MSMMRSSPIVAFVGTPLYSVYLRLMGARIGRNAAIACQFGPVAADMISIGENTIVRKDSILLGYRAQSNFIHIGPVEIGDNAFVGEASVVDIDTAMGDNTQLGHASSLQSGQRVPDGKRYHGSPAIETTSDYCQVEAREAARCARLFFASIELAALFLVAVPAPILAYHYWDTYTAGTALAKIGTGPLSLLGLSVLVFLGAIVLGCSRSTSSRACACCS